MSEIMSYSEYLSIQITKPTPYIFTLGQPPHILYYFGVRHSYDANDPQYPTLRKQWQSFLTHADSRNSLVFIEAGRRLPLRESETEAIQRNGESGLMTYLAHKANIPVDCPEPDSTTEFLSLRKLYQADDILFYYTARVVAQYFRVTNPPPLEEYVRPYIERDKRTFGQEAGHWSWDYFTQRAKLLNAPGFDKSSEKFWRNVANPTIEGTIINEVTRSCSQFRDEHISSEIIKQFRSGKSLFITYGSTHAIMQEPYLRSQLEIRE